MQKNYPEWIYSVILMVEHSFSLFKCVLYIVLFPTENRIQMEKEEKLYKDKPDIRYLMIIINRKKVMLIIHNLYDVMKITHYSLHLTNPYP